MENFEEHCMAFVFVLWNRVCTLVLRKSYFYLHESLKSKDQIHSKGSALELHTGGGTFRSSGRVARAFWPAASISSR